MRPVLRNLLLAAMIFTSSIAVAIDDLEPEDSPFTGIFLEDYTKIVLEALSGVYDRDVILRVVAFPSFQPEFAVAIRETAGAYTVLRLAPEKQLWAYKTKEFMESGQIRKITESGKSVKPTDEIGKIENEYPANFRDVPIRACSAPIDAPVAKDIRRAWELMLLNTKYAPDSHHGLDGTGYHFSMRAVSGAGSYAGKTWSPPKESTRGQLVGIANSLADYCMRESSRGEIMVRLKEQVTAILKTLDPKKR